MRKTKIICTIGPASENEETLKQMCMAGMNVARLNFSHGTHPEHQQKIDRIKKVREELGLPIVIMLDTKGPEYRIRTFENHKITLKDGDTFIFTTDEVEGNNERVSVSYKNLINELKIGDTILVNNGLLIFEVVKLKGNDAICKVKVGGEMSDRKSMNFPNHVMTGPYLSEQDKKDLLFGIKNEVDFVAASFVSTKQDLLDLRNFLNENGGSDIDIIAKIENAQGVANIDEILDAADGIMVARGDMGVEIPFEQIPAIQKELIRKAYNAGKNVITATQMLESMITNARPTRAEITDVANAIYDGSSAIMLSGETAAGKYPVEAVKTMSLIAETTEKDIDYISRFKKRADERNSSITDAISHATVTTAHDLNAVAILTVTKGGTTARTLSKFRPNCPIIALTTDDTTYHQLSLSWGIRAGVIEEKTNTDELIRHALERSVELGYLKKGDLVVITAGVPLGMSGTTNLLKVERA